MNVAQLVRALGCGPGGRGFETHHSPHLIDKIPSLIRESVILIFIYGHCN